MSRRAIYYVAGFAALILILVATGLGYSKLAPGVANGQSNSPFLQVETFVSGLTIPWDIAFTPDGTMVFTQKSGVLSSRLANGTVQEVDADFGDLYARGETGLMGIVVDPDFASNRRFYTCQGHTGPEVQIVAWTINSDYTEATRVADPLVGGLPASSGRHGGCRLRFGPQGFLWIATGDATTGTAPQDLTSLGGKVLRVDASTGVGGSTNPFTSSSRVYTYGHRNVQGLALRPDTNQMWSIEHGPSIDDEINLLASGGNYGWDPVPSYNESVSMTDLVKFPAAIVAKWSSGSPTLAPSGAAFLEGDRWGIWEGRLAVATLKDSKLRLFEFTTNGDFVSQDVVSELDGAYGRLRTPMLGPDGALYVTTSNGGGADRVLRITPGKAVFPGPGAQRSIAENTAAGMNIGAPITATHMDGDTLTYTLGGTDARSFSIVAETGQLQTRTVLDYESKPTHLVTITATDTDGGYATIIVTIDVTNLDDAGAVTLSTARPYLSVRLSATLADPDGGITGSNWQWFSSPDGSSDWAEIGGGTSATYTPVSGDLGRFLRAMVRYSDDFGSGKNAQAAATYAVQTQPAPPTPTPRPRSTGGGEGGGGGGGGSTPSNRAPEFREDPEAERTIAENTPPGETIGDPIEARDRDNDSLTYSLEGDDASSFDVGATSGQLLTKAPLDYEDKAGYLVTVSVHDGKSPRGRESDDEDDSIEVTIFVTNVDEPAVVILTADQPMIDVELIAELNDPDGGVFDVVWVWERSEDMSEWTAIDGAASAAYTPSIADKGFFLRARAAYRDGRETPKFALEGTAAAVPLNAAPMFPQGNLIAEGRLERSVAENTGVSGAVGGPVTAADPDQDTLTYKLAGPDTAFYTIDESTAQIRVGSGTTLDYEAGENAYTVEVTATDPAGLTATVTVAISVINVELAGRGAAYDVDNNEVIDREEAIAAVTDYFNDAITLDETLEVIRLYFPTDSFGRGGSRGNTERGRSAVFLHPLTPSERCG